MTAYRLRILSGRHEGAELPLTPRRYSLGSSEDNALILSDDAIAEHHLSFFFADGELSVLQAPGGLRIDGKVVDTFPVDVAPFQIMTLAGSDEEDNISLAYGTEASVADASVAEASVSDAAAEKSSDSNLPALRSWPECERIVALLSAGSGSVDPKVRQAKKKLDALSRLSPKKRKILVRSSLALGAVATVSIAVVVATLLWLDPARRQAERMQRVEASLEKELEAKPVGERTVRITQGQEGEIVLTGYVETEKELVRLRGIAFESGLQIRVVSKEQLRAALEVIARQYGLFAKFHLFAIEGDNAKKDEGEKGKALATSQESTKDSAKDSAKYPTKYPWTQLFRLRLEGFIDRERQLEEFRDALASDLPYITEIETDITTSTAILSGLRRLLAHNAAFGGVALELEEGRLLLQGAVFASFHDELRTLLEHHYRSLPYHPLTTDRLTLVPPLQASITALLLGRQRAVDLRLSKEGRSKRYRIGERIDDDKTIVAIAHNGILLSYADQTVGLPIATPALPALEQDATETAKAEKSESVDSKNAEKPNDKNKTDKNKTDQNKTDQEEVP